MSDSCEHANVVCLNEYEIVRKYRCCACDEVMMCRCDKVRGERFLSHQLSRGRELSSQREVRVTIGFQEKTCRECRGLKSLPFPMASVVGRTSKIKRFYWRELIFREFELSEEYGFSPDGYLFEDEHSAIREQIAIRALNDIKVQHEKLPKFSLETESEAAFLERINPPVLALTAKTLSGGQVETSVGVFVRPEEYACWHFSNLGFSTTRCESVPFHALFSVLLWMLIQDPFDLRLRNVTFGERSSFETHGHSDSSVWMQLPDDFGTIAYSMRRSGAIAHYFENVLPKEREALLSFFDISTIGSHKLQQYLWAYRTEDVSRARSLLEVLPPNAVHIALKYLGKH